MKISKELSDALEAVSKEVDSWPAWQRSIDLRDLESSEQLENRESSNEPVASQPNQRLSTRAARA